MSIRASLVSFFLRHTMRKQFQNFDDPSEIRGANSMPAKLPADVQIDKTDAGGVSAEWVRWPRVSEDHVMLYLHGGGYVFGGPDSHRDLAWRLGQASGVKVLVVDYRLAPEHVFPAAVDDATAAYRWLCSEGHKPENIVVAGDSAGGGLAVALMVNLKNLGLPLPSAAVLISPWADLSISGDSVSENEDKDPMLTPQAVRRFAELYLGDADAHAALASPIFADLAGLPPTMVLVGSTEILRSDAERLVEKINAAGGATNFEIWPNMPHVFPLLASLIPEGKQAVNDIGDFVAKALGTTPAEG